MSASSDRRAEVLAMRARGMMQKNIAALLGISEVTVSRIVCAAKESPPLGPQSERAGKCKCLRCGKKFHRSDKRIIRQCETCKKRSDSGLPEQYELASI